MSSLDLRVLVLERQRLQIQNDLDTAEGALGSKQPLDATLTALAALVGTPNTLPYFTATEVMNLAAFTAYSRSLLALGDAGTWCSTLGLGTMSVQNANAVAITGGGGAFTSGAVSSLGGFSAPHYAPDHAVGFYTTQNAGGLNRWAIYAGGTAASYFGGPLLFGDAAGTRTNLGLGTMSTQNASAVAITGGTITGPAVSGLGVTPGITTFYNEVGMGRAPAAGYSLVVAYQSWFDSNLGISGALTVSQRLNANLGITIANYAGNDATGIYSQMEAAGGTNRWFIYGAGAAPSILFGNVGIKTWPTAWDFEVNGYAKVHTGIGVGIDPIGGWAIVTNGYINTTASIGNKAGGGPWGDSSSRRLKRDIAPIRGALDLLLAQQGVEFAWDEPGRAAVLPGRQYGFILEDVTVPQWHDGPGVDGEPVLTLRGYEALLLEALRELTTRVQALEERA